MFEFAVTLNSLRPFVTSGNPRVTLNYKQVCSVVIIFLYFSTEVNKFAVLSKHRYSYLSINIKHVRHLQ